MNKSDKLDELRLEVGMIADRVNSRTEFYLEIINTIGKLIPESFGVAIYQCLDGYYSLLTGNGNISEKKVVKFGDGMFSVCSIRGKVIVDHNAGVPRAYAPFYDGHHLVGVFFVECKDVSYSVTEEDLIFLEEITKFIEVKGRQYENSAIDNREI